MYAQSLSIFKIYALHVAKWENVSELDPLCPACLSEPLCLMSVYKLVSVGGETAAVKSEASQDLV